jgi:hypothetical protein
MPSDAVTRFAKAREISYISDLLQKVLKDAIGRHLRSDFKATSIATLLRRTAALKK